MFIAMKQRRPFSTNLDAELVKRLKIAAINEGLDANTKRVRSIFLA